MMIRLLDKAAVKAYPGVGSSYSLSWNVERLFEGCAFSLGRLREKSRGGAAELKGIGLARYGAEFMPEGQVLLRHLKLPVVFSFRRFTLRVNCHALVLRLIFQRA